MMSIKSSYCLSLFLVLVSFIYSCDVAPDCTTTDDMEEFESVEGLQGVAIYDSIFLLPHILDTTVQVGQEYRIETEEEYQALFPAGECLDCRLPPINLDTHTLIGKYLNEECLAVFTRKMIKIDETHYRYLVKVIKDTRCVSASCLNFSFNFIAVPKLAEDAEVEIEVGHRSVDCDC